MIDYRKLRPGNIASPEFRHLFLLIYWPVYGLTFFMLERFFKLTYNTVQVDFDQKIPFCEWFAIPYYYWFAFVVGIHIYTLFFDVPAFKKLMYFIIITYTLTSIIYVIYPTKQELRPTEFQNNNILIAVVKNLYNFDTNTNVCPSLHVIGSFAVLFTSWQCGRFKTFWWQFSFIVSTLLISVSTVFLKQHSIIDIWAALAVCAIAYPFAYILPGRIKKRKLVTA